MSTTKVIVAGSVNGRFEEFFDKLNTVNSRNGPFACCFCVGDFFGTNVSSSDDPSGTPHGASFASLRSGSIKVPIPTYFFCDKNEHPEELGTLNKDGGALCPNLYYLGGDCGIKQIAGLAIAFYSRDCAECMEKLISLAEAHSTAPKNALLNQSFVSSGGGDSGSTGGGGVDILLTNTVPLGVTNLTANGDVFPVANTLFSFNGAKVARGVRPRYHFSGGSTVFWGRQPYRNEPWNGAGSRHYFTTRYYSLAPFDNPDKQRFMFAAAVQQIATMQHEDVPADVTESPYIVYSRRRPRDDEADGDEGEGDGVNHYERSAKRRQQQRQPYFVRDSDSCWFCLSNPSVEKHLIVRTGKHCYVSVAKGPICPGHMLVVPVHHIPSTIAFSSLGTSDGSEALSEILRTIKAVAKCLLDPSGPFHASAVLAFERYIPNTVVDKRTKREKEIQAHGMVHIVPLPSQTNVDGIDSVFEARGATSGAEFEKEDWLSVYSTCAEQQGDDTMEDRFFWYRVMTTKSVDSEEEEERGSFMVKCAHGVGRNMHINFGRFVACCIAGMVERNDWHRCVLPKDEEINQTKECHDALVKYLPDEDQNNKEEKEDVDKSDQ